MIIAGLQSRPPRRVRQGRPCWSKKISDDGEVETGTWEAGSDQTMISLVGAANVMPTVRRLSDASTFWLLAIPD